MIFVSLGSQKFQFDRLLKAVDELQIDDEIYAQTGYSNYKPVNYKYTRFLDRDEFDKVINRSEIVITHGGTGAVIGALKKHKKIIAVPRLSKYGEHVDDHQLQLVRMFQDMNYIYACEDMDLNKALTVVKNSKYDLYENNTMRFIQDLEGYIDSF